MRFDLPRVGRWNDWNQVLSPPHQDPPGDDPNPITIKLSLPPGHVYRQALTPADARKWGEALIKAADDKERELAENSQEPTK